MINNECALKLDNLAELMFRNFGENSNYSLEVQYDYFNHERNSTQIHLKALSQKFLRLIEPLTQNLSNEQRTSVEMLESISVNVKPYLIIFFKDDGFVLCLAVPTDGVEIRLAKEFPILCHVQELSPKSFAVLFAVGDEIKD